MGQSACAMPVQEDIDAGMSTCIPSRLMVRGVDSFVVRSMMTSCVWSNTSTRKKVYLQRLTACACACASACASMCVCAVYTCVCVCVCVRDRFTSTFTIDPAMSSSAQEHPDTPTSIQQTQGAHPSGQNTVYLSLSTDAAVDCPAAKTVISSTCGSQASQSSSRDLSQPRPPTSGQAGP